MALTVALLAAKVWTLPLIEGVGIIDGEDSPRVPGALLIDVDETP